MPLAFFRRIRDLHTAIRVGFGIHIAKTLIYPVMRRFSLFVALYVITIHQRYRQMDGHHARNINNTICHKQACCAKNGVVIELTVPPDGEERARRSAIAGCLVCASRTDRRTDGRTDAKLAIVAAAQGGKKRARRERNRSFSFSDKLPVLSLSLAYHTLRQMDKQVRQYGPTLGAAML